MTEITQNGIWMLQLNPIKSNFIDSLAHQKAKSPRGLTDRQVAVLNRIADEFIANGGAFTRNAAGEYAVDSDIVLEPVENKPAPPILSNIIAAFESASANGKKTRILRFEGLVLKAVGEHSTNPGCVYVLQTHEDEQDSYEGKIKPDGVTVGLNFPIREKLVEIDADVTQAAVDYGRATGQCCCCGRLLTNPTSIEAGIGPICADNWGM